ncbi:MAG: MBL fold metallo-hydrolase [Eggerthellaceae bacterium]
MLSRLIHTEPDVYLVEVPLASTIAPSTNCYIVKDGESSLVIDTGSPGTENERILAQALIELDVDGARTAYALTHLHRDHAGLVVRMVPPGCTLSIGASDGMRTDASCVAADAARLRTRMLAEGPRPKRRTTANMHRPVENWTSRARRGARSRRDAIRGRWSLAALDMPGTRPGISRCTNAHRACFLGDRVLQAISPSIDLFPNGADGMQAYLHSLCKVKNLPLSLLAWGHGPLRNDFAQRIEHLIVHHHERLNEVLGIVADKPGRTGIEIVRAVRWSVPFDSWERIPLRQRSVIVAGGLASLDHLVVQGSIDRFIDSKGAYRYRIGTRAVGSAGRKPAVAQAGAID